MDNIGIQTSIIIPGIKLKLSYTKTNEYGYNQFVQVLDENRLQYMFKLAEENMKMPVWKYNDKCYIKTNQQKINQYAIDQSNKTQDGETDTVEFEQEHPYIMDLTFNKYEFEKETENILKGYIISEIYKTY